MNDANAVTIKRSNLRLPDSMRPIVIEPHYYDYAEGSCWISYGNTQVICAATIEDSPPPHLRGKGMGWVTGEYSMLPKASRDRIRRERSKVGGRTYEIQRLIGRALRSVVNPQGWGERTITIDCDVIRADGGTRTASITGAFVALVLAFRHLKKNARISQDLKFPVKDFISAVSVGIVSGVPVLDLDYVEDSSAETDMNLVMTALGEFVEIQGTAEKEPFTMDQFQELMALGKKGCENLCQMQRQVLGPLDWAAGKPL
jgi:ribonuclease PH